MFRLALENLLARKFRLVSTSLSVMIGVAFLAGSMVLIDTIRSTFDSLFADIYESVDVVVRSDESIDSDFGEVRGTIDEDVLAIVRGVDGVIAADADIQGYAQLVDVDGDPIGNPGQGAPTFGFPWTDVDELNPMVIVEGAPRGTRRGRHRQVQRRTGTVRGGRHRHRAAPGTTRAVPRQRDRHLRRRRHRARLVDHDLHARDRATCARRARPCRLGQRRRCRRDQPGRTGGAGRGCARRRPRWAGTEVITGEDLTTETQDDVQSALGFFNTFMLVFAVVALFVAAFIIYNTFSIILAQRTRELALLRALGAGRGQVLGSVLFEAVIVGLVASAVGIVAGLGVAALLKQLLEGFGIDIPTGSVVFEADTVWVSLLVGVGVTVLSAVVPSRRASTIAPMEALRDSSRRRPRRARSPARGRRRSCWARPFAAGLGPLRFASGSAARHRSRRRRRLLWHGGAESPGRGTVRSSARQAHRRLARCPG